jgi:hypothetical protein
VKNEIADFYLGLLVILRNVTARVNCAAVGGNAACLGKRKCYICSNIAGQVARLILFDVCMLTLLSL